MDDKAQPSLLNRIATPIVFLVGGLAALWWFIHKLYLLVSSRTDAIVLVDKGAYYMLGVSLGMLALALVIIWEQWLRKPLTGGITAAFSRTAIAAIVTLIAAPQLIHYAANSYLASRNYSVCEKASTKWLFVRSIAYMDESTECRNLALPTR